MVDTLVAKKLLAASDRAKAVKALQECWQDKIAVVWAVDDVKEAASHDGAEEDPSDDVCRQVLAEALANHDANNGITWEILKYHAEQIQKLQNGK